MGWGEVWERGAEALIAGKVGALIGPPPWKDSTENHRAGLYSTWYWQEVQRGGDLGLPGEFLRDWLRRQREEGLFLREALGPVYDAAWVASLLIAWHGARERLARNPTDEVAKEIEALALGGTRFALGLAMNLRVSDGTVFAPGPRAKALETAAHLERGLTTLAHWWSPVEAPHPDLLRHLKVGGRWLEQHGAAQVILDLATPELREAIALAGYPTLQGRLSHPLYWRRDGDTLEVWAPWLHVRNEDGGAHERSGVWASLGWDAHSRHAARCHAWIQGGTLPDPPIVHHPSGMASPERILGGWSFVGPMSRPWPVTTPVAAPPAEPPPEEPAQPAPDDADDAPPKPLARWRIEGWLEAGGCPPELRGPIAEIVYQAQQAERQVPGAEDRLREAVRALDAARAK